MIQLSSIRTSSSNKQIVSELTKKLTLGTENVIARIALAYSFSNDKRLSLKDIQDSKGKEYSKNVLFGTYYPIYVSMICVLYNVHKSDKDIPKYLKLHIDDGLQLLNEEYKRNPGLSGLDFLTSKIESGLSNIDLFD